jgi:multidrug efflux pump subunit AcrB
VNRAIAWFAENHVAANLLMLVIMAGGLFTLPTIKQEVFPEVRIEVVTVSVVYRGAAPEEVEEAVCVRVEEAIQGVEGLKRVTATASEGVGVVTAELEPGADVRQALDDIKARVDAIDTFPDETEKPIVQQAIMRAQVINVAVSGDVDERTLRHTGQQVRDEIVTLPGVTHADLANVRPYEVSIEVSEDDLRRHGLTFDDVSAAVRRSSMDLPGGTLRTSSGEILLRTKGQAYHGPEFEQLVLLARDDGTRVLLGDVAEVVDGFEETDSFARFDGHPAVLVQVFRVGDQSALDVAAKVRAYVVEAQARMPPGIALTTWQDDSLILKARLETLVGDAWQGFALVLIALALFMQLRTAFWVGMGIPIAVLGTLWILPGLDVSINLLTLFAFLLVLGVLVDDAIVVGENVYTLQSRRRDPLRAAIAGVQEVSTPVTFGVLCTVAAFTPLLMIPGAMGKLTASIPLVVISALLVSLVETQLILPAHLGHVKPSSGRRPNALVAWWGRVQERTSLGLERFVRHGYTPFLERALAYRYLTVAVGVGVLVVTVGLVGGGWARFVFMPQVEADNVIAFLTMPQGTPADVTAAAIRRLEESAERVRASLEQEGAGDVFHHVLASVGEQPYRQRQEEDRTGGKSSGVSAGHLGEINIELAPAEERTVTSAEVAARWREATGAVPDAVELSFTSSLFSAGAAISVQLQGRDDAGLRRAAEMLKERLAAFQGVYDVSDSFRGGKQEVKLRIRPSAEALGLSLNDLARQVRQAFYGDEAQRIQRGRDDVRVMVRYPRDERRSLGDLEGMRIRTADGTAVPFSAVAEATLGRGFAAIQRADRERVITVTADVDEAVTSPNEVTAALHDVVLPEVLTTIPGISYSMQGEQREQQEFLDAMLRRFGLALLMIYVLLAIPLRSYLQPFLIMAAIPFAMVGAIWGHVMLGWDLSMFSVIGLVALSGVVVNDSLVLVDYVNQRRNEGVSLGTAARTAGAARFRPIILNSVTSFVGLTPLLLNRSVQAQFLIPMAIALTFGVLLSTLVTLVLVPSAYLILDDISALFGRRAPAADPLEHAHAPTPAGEPVGEPAASRRSSH